MKTVNRYYRKREGGNTLRSDVARGDFGSVRMLSEVHLDFCFRRGFLRGGIFALDEEARWWLGEGLEAIYMATRWH